MKVNDFNKIINTMTIYLTQGINAVEKFKNKGDILNLTDNEFNNYFSQVQNLHGIMDKFNTDFYHLIGMGNLSGPQTMLLCQLVKKVESIRHNIKLIVNTKSHLKVIRETILNNERSYNLGILPSNNNVTLTIGGN